MSTLRVFELCYTRVIIQNYISTAKVLTILKFRFLSSGQGHKAREPLGLSLLLIDLGPELVCFRA